MSNPLNRVEDGDHVTMREFPDRGLSESRDAPCSVSFVDQKMADDPAYAPYCMRCKGLQRMRRVSPTLAECPVCPAVHEIEPNMALCVAPGANDSSTFGA